MKALTAAEMREVDRLSTSRFGISGAQLMETAGQRVSEAILRDVDERYGREARGRVRVSILCGKGNNGGDGLVVARHLQLAGLDSKVYLFGESAKFSGDAGENLQRWRNTGGFVQVAAGEESWEKIQKLIAGSHVIVDALLGTGLRGAASGLLATAIAGVNELSGNGTLARPALIVSVDIPSGLPSDGKAAEGPVVQAHKTVTFTAPKIGQLVSRDAPACGRLEVAAIGSPAALIEEQGSGLVRWADAQEFAELALVRAADSNKGTFGHVLLVAGSRGKSGAAILGGRMAVRAGAGLVTVATPAEVLPVVAGAQAEYMTVPLEATAAGTIGLKNIAPEKWKKIEKGMTVLAVGPGLGMEEETQRAIRAMVVGTELPIILDADGLNAFDGHAGELRERKSKFLAVTPHPGEMGRLLGCSTEEVQNDRLKAAREAAKSWNAHVILKGFHTIVASPDGKVFVNTTGNAGLAKGGTGDVLTGLLAALTAQFKTEDWLRVLTLGVYLHGLAADLGVTEMDASGLIADDLIALVPAARGKLLRELQELG
jgi:ADP-dependent NAD(P)H-hydrate dehydratase / NAD(P)H-hydrate epimerase